MGLAANEYLQFGSTGAIEYYKTVYGDHCFGESNQNGGTEKGIAFAKDGYIQIG